MLSSSCLLSVGLSLAHCQPALKEATTTPRLSSLWAVPIISTVTLP